MKKYLLTLLPLLVANLCFGVEDVCCVLGGGSGSGDSVQTYARIMSSNDCKQGGTFEGRKVCAAVADPENTYCGGASSYQDRCSKCGFFWSGKECLTVDPKEKAKKELEEEAKKKEAEKNGTAPANPDAPVKAKPVDTPAPKPADPDNPNVNNANPETDSLFSRKSKGITIN